MVVLRRAAMGGELTRHACSRPQKWRNDGFGIHVKWAARFTTTVDRILAWWSG
jgi:hypothetical protein